MKLRIVEIFKDNEWIVLKGMGELKIGDIFRLTEPIDKELVKDQYGKTQWTAASNPYRVLNDDKIYTYAIEIEEEK